MTTTTPEKRDALASLRIQRSEDSPRTNRPRKSWFRRLVAAALLAGLLFGGYMAATKTGWLSVAPKWLKVPEIIQSRVEVRVAKPAVESGRSADALVVASGYLESRRQARIGARAPGRIEVVHVEEGSVVAKDQVLAVLEHADLDASLAASRASLSRVKSQLAEQDITIAQAKRDYERALQLWQSKSSSEAEFDKKKFEYDSMVARLESMKAELELAQARVSEAEQLRENMFVHAPFDGTVISKDAEVGESIMPGGMGEASGRGSVVTIADLSNLEVDCDVKEDFISRVVEGNAAEIVVDAVPDRRYKGLVRKIIPMGDRARATIKVKVAITDADSRLFPEMSGTVYFLPPQGAANEPANDNPRMFVPETAIQDVDGSKLAWLIDAENRAQRKSVTCGASRDGRIEILGGLNDSDRVVVNPTGISEGQLVKVLEN